MDNPILVDYKNGDSQIKIYKNGTRIVEFPESVPNLDYPLNVDIRISSRCSLGLNPKTGNAFCSFCHESATTDGDEADYNLLQIKLKGLPSGVELAIGSNNLNQKDIEFFEWCYDRGFIVNLTINQMHIKRDLINLKYLIEKEIIKGLGLSLRSIESYDSLPSYIKDYKNLVVHVIAGLDDFEKVINSNIKKILILGYKKFGKGEGYYSLREKEIDKNLYKWKTNFIRLYPKKHISFDNLSLKQLEVQKWISTSDWKTFYQGENSFYINAVEGSYSPSSRSPLKESWDTISLKDYFDKSKTLNKD